MQSRPTQGNDFPVKNHADSHVLPRQLCINDDYADNGLCPAGHKPFAYLESNLLNGRTFTSLEHLNATTALWLADIADVHLHRETKRRPIDLYQEEKPHLLGLPARAYDTAQVFYRTVN